MQMLRAKPNVIVSLLLAASLTACATPISDLLGSDAPKKDEHDPAFVVCRTFDWMWYEATDAEQTKTDIDVFDKKLGTLCPQKIPPTLRKTAPAATPTS